MSDDKTLGYTPLDGVNPVQIKRMTEKLGGISPYLYYYIKENFSKEERLEAIKLIRKIQSMDMEDLQREIGMIGIDFHNKLATAIEELYKSGKYPNMSRMEIAKMFVGTPEAKEKIVEEFVKYADKYKHAIKLIAPLIESYLHPGRVAEYLRAGAPLWYYLVVSKPGGFEWIADITKEVRKRIGLHTEEEEYEKNKEYFEKALKELTK